MSNNNPKVRWAQIYSTKQISLKDLTLTKNPYREDAKDQEEALRELGVVFWRDEDNTNAAFHDDMEGEPADMLYFQFSYFMKTGKVDMSTVVWENRPVHVLWMKKNMVKRTT